MVVALLKPERQRDSDRRTCLLQKLRAQFLFDERVGRSDIDEQLGQPRPVLDERDGVVSAPRRVIVAEIAGKRLLSSRYLRRRDDRCEGRDASEPLGEIESDRQRAVPAHRMAGDPLAISIDRELAHDDRR